MRVLQPSLLKRVLERVGDKKRTLTAVRGEAAGGNGEVPVLPGEKV